MRRFWMRYGKKARWSFCALALSAMVWGAATTSCAAFGRRPEGARLERIRHSENAVNDRFVNLVPTQKTEDGTLLHTLWGQVEGRQERTPSRAIPVDERRGADFELPPTSGLRVTWIGHATTLVEIDGGRVLFDPVWSERVSPNSHIGPLRHHPVPIPLEELPPIDAVVISHDHYDHLDMATVVALASSTRCRFVVPIGVGAHLDAWSIPADRIQELDWHERTTFAGMTVIATPARHYSGRGLADGDRTQWASWVVRGRTRAVYFSGDTGDFDEFGRIGEQYGPFDITLLKIGAYGPTWPDVHMTPEEAVSAHVKLRGSLLLPVHWATFNLAFHAWNEPADRVLSAARSAGVRLAVPRPGQMVDLGAPPAPQVWWR